MNYMADTIFLQEVVIFIQKNILFDILIGILFLRILYIGIVWSQNYKEWAKKLEDINVNRTNLKKSEFEELEENLKAIPELNQIMNPLREFAVESKTMTVTEIHSIVEDKILEPESKISTSSSGFLLIGLFWTLSGIFMAMHSAFNDSGMMFKGQEMLQELLDGFKVSFSSTFIGIAFSMIGYLIQELLVKARREDFLYHLVLYVKNVFLPKKGIPDVSKNLGSLVRSLENSSATLEECSESIVKLSQSAQSDSETILAAIEGFRNVTDEMSKREESLTSIFDHQSRYFEDIRSTLRDIEIPIKELSIQISNRDIKIQEEIQVVNKIHDLQSQLHITAEKALNVIAESENQMSSFFGEKFPKVLDGAIENFNNLHSEELNSIIKKIESTSRNVDSGFKELANLKDDIGNDFQIIINGNDEIRNSTSNIIRDLNILRDAIAKLFDPENSQKLKEVYLSSKKIDSIESQIEFIKKSMRFIDDIPKRLDNIEPSMIKSLEKSFSKLEKKINKISTTSYSLFGGSRNEKK